jgi:hypothetical protein
VSKRAPQVKPFARSRHDDSDLQQIGIHFEHRDATASRSSGQAVNDLAIQDPRILTRVGYQRKDGSRVGARIVRRVEAYLSPALADALTIETIRRRSLTGRRTSIGEVIEEGLAAIGIGAAPLTKPGHPGKRAATTRPRAAKKKAVKKKPAKKKRAA